MMEEPWRALAAADSGQAEAERILKENARRTRELPADYYGWNRPWNQFRHFQILRACIRALVAERMFPLSGLRVLDVGCGTGAWLMEFVRLGASCRDLCGIDLDPERIRRASLLLPAGDLICGDGRALPWPAESMDLVSQFTVFTSILSVEVRRAVAAEMIRVLRPGGAVLWYDFRVDNPRNPNVRGVGAAEIRSLFPGCALRLWRVTLAPPIARPLARFSWPLALMADSIPFLRTHYLALIRKAI